MSKKRITVDSVENPSEGSAFFILSSPLESENDEQTKAPAAPQMQEPEALEVQIPEAKTELANSLVVESGDKKEVDASEDLVAQENEAETPSKQTSQQSKVLQNSTRKSAPRRRVGRPNNPRYTKRQSFELFEDQMIDLRTLQARQKLQKGRKVALSKMVREALDAYLQAKGYSHPVFRPEEGNED